MISKSVTQFYFLILLCKSDVQKCYHAILLLLTYSIYNEWFIIIWLSLFRIKHFKITKNCFLPLSIYEKKGGELLTLDSNSSIPGFHFPMEETKGLIFLFQY